MEKNEVFDEESIEFDFEDVSPLNKLIDAGEIEGAAFPFYFQRETGKWVVPTEMCSLGGCDKDFLEFDTEQEAYDEALKMTKEGKEQKINYACPACLLDYKELNEI